MKIKTIVSNRTDFVEELVIRPENTKKKAFTEEVTLLTVEHRELKCDVSVTTLINLEALGNCFIEASITDALGERICYVGKGISSNDSRDIEIVLTALASRKQRPLTVTVKSTAKCNFVGGRATVTDMTEEVTERVTQYATSPLATL